MEITEEQMMAYTEVIEILKHMSKEDSNKIPADVIQYYKNHMDISYKFEVDETKTFKEQKLSEKAKIVLAILYRDYWATAEQKEKIKQNEKYDIYQLELEKQRKYNIENIFENRDKQETEETKSLAEYKKETWFHKFLHFMGRFFYRNDK